MVRITFLKPSDAYFWVRPGKPALLPNVTKILANLPISQVDLIICRKTVQISAQAAYIKLSGVYYHKNSSWHSSWSRPFFLENFCLSTLDCRRDLSRTTKISQWPDWCLWSNIYPKILIFQQNPRGKILFLNTFYHVKLVFCIVLRAKKIYNSTVSCTNYFYGPIYRFFLLISLDLRSRMP